MGFDLLEDLLAFVHANGGSLTGTQRHCPKCSAEVEEGEDMLCPECNEEMESEESDDW